MEELAKQIDLVIVKFADMETEINIADLNIHRKSYHAIDEAKDIIKKGESYLQSIDDLISQCLASGEMTPEISQRFQQLLVSIYPKIETSITILKESFQHPPEESETTIKGEQEFESILQAGLELEEQEAQNQNKKDQKETKIQEKQTSSEATPEATSETVSENPVDSTPQYS